MGCPTINFEGSSVVSLGPFNHSESVPVALEEVEGLGVHSIHRQDAEAAVAVQGAIGLMYI